MNRFGIILVIALFQVLPLLSQNIDIPDQCFIDALIEEGVDTNEIPMFISPRIAPIPDQVYSTISLSASQPIPFT